MNGQTNELIYCQRRVVIGKWLTTLLFSSTAGQNYMQMKTECIYVYICIMTKVRITNNRRLFINPVRIPEAFTSIIKHCVETL